jgi:predicted peptidase
MPSRRNFISVGFALGVSALVEMPLLAAGPVKSATAVARVFGEGQKLIAVALEYAEPVNGAKLSSAGWKVEGRTVTGVYASSSSDPADRAANGRFVIVELSPKDPGALLREGGAIGGGPGPGPGGPAGPGGPPPQGGPGGPGGPPPGGMGPPPRNLKTNYLPAKAKLLQSGAVTTASGKTLAASSTTIATTGAKDLLVDQFRQFSFKDAATGDTMGYNLFLPKGYDPKQRYPLLLFMHDAGASSTDTLVTLKQGLGAVIWSDPAEQAKRPCIILAPQWNGMVVNDKSETTSLFDTTVHLIEKISRDYAVDRNRIYSTGQSGGAMMTIAINIKYPDLFAASFIVAGQWDPELCRPIARCKMWIMVSEGDLKAFPGQNAITAVLEKESAKITRATWDGRWSPTEFAQAAAEVEAKGTAINYTPLVRGSVVPPGMNDNGGSNHVNTWRIAYTVEPIRDWLFRQRKG